MHTGSKLGAAGSRRLPTRFRAAEFRRPRAKKVSSGRHMPTSDLIWKRLKSGENVKMPVEPAETGSLRTASRTICCSAGVRRLPERLAKRSV